MEGKNAKEAVKQSYGAKGITLIALIITIIVMLILVSVSINIVINSGLFESAGMAVNETKKAGEYEQQLASGIFNIEGDLYQSIEDVIEGIKLIKEGETAKDGNSRYKEIIIPKGFTVSKIPGEYENIDEGIVIYDLDNADSSDENFWHETVEVGDQIYPKVQTEYNQFVWIPVKKAVITQEEISKIIRESNGSIETEVQAVQSLANIGIYPMSVQMESGNYRGILYDFSNWNGTTGIKVIEFSSKETDLYENEKPYNREPSMLLTGGDSLNGITQTYMQDEYNKMIESVRRYNGFYVARYELSFAEKAKSKRGKEVTVALLNDTKMWYGLYFACYEMYDQNAEYRVTSEMISGAQWDQIMIWMKDVKNTTNNNKYYILDSSGMGNYNVRIENSILKGSQTSGYLEAYKIKNVFDLAGNFNDWTTETSSTQQRTMRGSSWSYSGERYPCAGRYQYSPSSAISYFSTRAILYMK